jgi:hypothetical protein
MPIDFTKMPFSQITGLPKCPSEGQNGNFHGHYFSNEEKLKQHMKK